LCLCGERQGSRRYFCSRSGRISDSKTTWLA
jgi:hypothetical protein